MLTLNEQESLLEDVGLRGIMEGRFGEETYAKRIEIILMLDI
jgi:hypothetical protein